MNPDTQLILDEISKRFEEHDKRWDARMRDQESAWNTTFTQFTTGHDSSVAALEHVAADLEDWRPGVEGTLDDLRIEVNKIAKH